MSRKEIYHEPHEPSRTPSPISSLTLKIPRQHTKNSWEKEEEIESRVRSVRVVRGKFSSPSWLIILFLFLSINSFACDAEGHFAFNVLNEEEILYMGCYDAINLGPHIIEYILTKERAEATGIRRPRVPFTQDRDGGVLQMLLAENGYSLPHHSDYTHSGYDRGHMAPNADFNDSYENAVMTFFIANVWPQLPTINRSEWLKTENETRRFASEYEFIKVIIIVDEFYEEKVAEITIPSCFKRRVYDLYTGDLIYEIDIYQ